MIRNIALLVTIFILTLPASAMAAKPGSGIIEGRIVNGTQDGSSVAAQEITLRIYLDDTELDPTTTKTDADGRFVFDGLSTEPGYSYQVRLTFQQVAYNSDWVSFDAGETSKFTEVIVYNSTTSNEAIKVAMAHAVIRVGQGSLEVMEYFLFVNEADQTYIGSKEAPTPGGKETLRFSLPKEATKLQPEYGLMKCCIIGSEEGFIDTMPVKPGTREVAFSYRLNYSSMAYTFSKRVNYPTAVFALLVGGEDIEVASDQLTTEEPLNIQGILFNHLSGTDFAPGDILVAKLSGLPKTNNRGTIIWVALALGVLVGGFGLSYLLRKKRLQPVSSEGSLDQMRQSLLVEIAQLDDEFEDGKISEEVYRRIRADKKAQLVELMRRSKRGDR